MNKTLYDILNFLDNAIDWALYETCPNCISAHTGGVKDPDARTFCTMCSDKEGHITFRVFRINFLARYISQRNFFEYQRIKNAEKTVVRT